MRRIALAFICVFTGQTAAFPQDGRISDPGCTDSLCGECALITASAAPGGDDLWTRSQLTGDWGGSRSSLAEQGITFAGDVTQFYMGITRGGRNTESAYGGHADYVLNFDLDQLVGCQGAFLKLRAEHRFGETVNQDAGTFLPATLNPNLPVADSREVYLTNVLFTQFLTPKLGVFFGKLDTLDGDLNAYAHGRGKTQFFNTSLVANPALLRAVPYSTLGVGAIYVLDPESMINITVLNATDTTRTSGIEELFEEGMAVALEARRGTNLFGLPGHQLIGAAWNSRDFVALEQDPRFVIPALGVPIARTTGTWAAYYNFDQTLVADPCDPSHGWGVFGRFGISDGNPNPIEWFLSFGVGGNSPLRGRASDTFGVGWFLNNVSDDLGPIATAVLGADDGQGVELFYNMAVTPWLQVTPDIQYLHPAARNLADDAVIVGVRVNLTL